MLKKLYSIPGMKNIIKFNIFFIFFVASSGILGFFIWQLALRFATSSLVNEKVQWGILAYLLIGIEGILGFRLIRLSSRILEDAIERRKKYGNPRK